VDEDDGGTAGSAPIEEVDSVAIVGDDDVAGRLGRGVHEARIGRDGQASARVSS
jgi:hypothetical protein